MDELWLGYQEKKLSWNTQLFGDSHVVKDHACEVTVKFFAMKLEILVLSWKSEK